MHHIERCAKVNWYVLAATLIKPSTDAPEQFQVLSSINYQLRYDQSKMREHFLRCLESGEMSPFPSEMVRRIKRPAVKKVQLHCD